MVKLQWLQINKFRSVKPGTRLTFNPGYNVLLGQNGTGKTTLLNLVAAVVRSNFEELREIDFDLRYELSTEAGTATIWVRNEPELRLNAGPSQFRAGLTSEEMLTLGMSPSGSVFSSQILHESKSHGRTVIEMQGGTGTLLVMDGKPLDSPVNIKLNPNAYLSPRQTVLSLFHKLDIWASFSEMLKLFSELQMCRFDESLDYFMRLPSVEFYLARSFTTLSSGFAPAELQITLHSLAQDQWGQDRYVINHSRLRFLQQVIRLLDFESAEAILELQESGEHVTGRGMKLSNLRFLFTHAGGWRISEKSLSYGQKRMLAFLYYLATVSSVAVADELVNGLHHRWIRACIEALGQRQVFLTSQNPLLLDYLTFDAPEKVRETFILCGWEGQREQARMLWENMSQEAAEDFFDSYKVGFQQVGELLQAKGLW